MKNWVIYSKASGNSSYLHIMKYRVKQSVVLLYLKNQIWDLTKALEVTHNKNEAVELSKEDAERCAEMLNAIYGKRAWYIENVQE